MLKERLQVLVTPQQRDRLQAEARRRGTSVGAVVRDAVDAQLGTVAPERRRAALERILARDVGPMPSPEELNRIIDEEHEAAYPELLRERPR